MQTGRDRQECLSSSFNESDPRVSPDGRWLAYVSGQSGRAEVYVAPLDRSSESVRVSNGANRDTPRWSGDSRELCYDDEAAAQFLSVLVNWQGEAARQSAP